MILCCGEALIDMLPRTTRRLARNAYAPYAGGAIFTRPLRSVVSAIPTSFFTGLSDDMLGDVLRETLTARASLFARRDLLAPDDGGLRQAGQRVSATYAFYDSEHRRADDHAGRSAEARRRLRGDAFGAISLIPDPCGDAYEAC